MHGASIRRRDRSDNLRRIRNRTGVTQDIQTALRSDRNDARISSENAWWLLPCREVTTLGQTVVMDEFGIGLHGPTLERHRFHQETR